MREVLVTTSILFTFGVAPAGILGYLIAVKGKRNLISGWDDSKVRDPRGFGSLLGASLMVFSALLLAVVFLWVIGAMSNSVLMVTSLLLTLLPILGWLLARSRYG